MHSGENSGFFDPPVAQLQGPVHLCRQVVIVGGDQCRQSRLAHQRVKRFEKTVFYGGGRLFSTCQKHGADSKLFATVRRSPQTGKLVATPVREDIRKGNVSLRRVGTDAEIASLFDEVEMARKNPPDAVCKLIDLGCAAPGCPNKVHVKRPSFAKGYDTYYKVFNHCKAMINPSNKGQARAHPQIVKRWHPETGPWWGWPVWKVKFDHDAKTWTNVETAGWWCDENGVASEFKGRPKSDGADA